MGLELGAHVDRKASAHFLRSCSRPFSLGQLETTCVEDSPLHSCAHSHSEATMCPGRRDSALQSFGIGEETWDPGA